MFKTYTEIDNYVGNEIDYGKIIEFSGANYSYKTSCMLSIVKSILQNNLNSIVLYFDCDNHIQEKYLNDYGLDKMQDRFMISCINKSSDILDIINMIAADAVDDLIVVIDSIGGISFFNAYKELNKFLIQLNKTIYNTKISVLITNQYRYNSAQSKYVSYCSKCFNLYSSLRLNINHKQDNFLNLSIVKNKITGQISPNIRINIEKTNERK